MTRVRLAYRRLVLVTSLLVLTICLACVVSFNVIITLQNSASICKLHENLTSSDNGTATNDPLHFENGQKAWILAAPFLGACVLSVPVMRLMHSLGPRWTEWSLVCLNGLVTLLTPLLLTSVNLWVLFGCRLLQVVNKWSPLTERGLFVSTLTGYLQLSCVIPMTLAGLLMKFFTWQTVFYVHGGLAILLATLWMFVYSNDSNNNTWCSDSEKMLITKGKPNNQAPKTIPYYKIFTTPAIIGVFIAVVGNFYVFNFANTFLPSYLHHLVGFEATTSSFISAGILSLQLVVKILTGMVKWSNSLAFCAASMFLSVASVVPSHSALGATIAIALPFIVLGANGGGFPKSAILISGQHTPFVMAMFQVVLCGSFLLGSLTVPHLTPSQSATQFGRLFVIYAAVLLATNGLFVWLCSATPASWARPQSAGSTTQPSRVKVVPLNASRAGTDKSVCA